jgi:hypothetical protein
MAAWLFAPIVCQGAFDPPREVWRQRAATAEDLTQMRRMQSNLRRQLIDGHHLPGDLGSQLTS